MSSRIAALCAVAFASHLFGGQVLTSSFAHTRRPPAGREGSTFPSSLTRTEATTLDEQSAKMLVGQSVVVATNLYGAWSRSAGLIRYTAHGVQFSLTGGVVAGFVNLQPLITRSAERKAIGLSNDAIVAGTHTRTSNTWSSFVGSSEEHVRSLLGAPSLTRSRMEWRDAGLRCFIQDGTVTRAVFWRRPPPSITEGILTSPSRATTGRHTSVECATGCSSPCTHGVDEAGRTQCHVSSTVVTGLLGQATGVALRLLGTPAAETVWLHYGVRDVAVNLRNGAVQRISFQIRHGGRMIGGVRIGSSCDEVLNALGQPRASTTGAFDTCSLNYAVPGGTITFRCFSNAVVHLAFEALPADGSHDDAHEQKIEERVLRAWGSWMLVSNAVNAVASMSQEQIYAALGRPQRDYVALDWDEHGVGVYAVSGTINEVVFRSSFKGALPHRLHIGSSVDDMTEALGAAERIEKVRGGRASMASYPSRGVSFSLSCAGDKTNVLEMTISPSRTTQPAKPARSFENLSVVTVTNLLGATRERLMAVLGVPDYVSSAYWCTGLNIRVGCTFGTVTVVNIHGVGVGLATNTMQERVSMTDVVRTLGKPGFVDGRADYEDTYPAARARAMSYRAGRLTLDVILDSNSAVSALHLSASDGDGISGDAAANTALDQRITQWLAEHRIGARPVTEVVGMTATRVAALVSNEPGTVSWFASYACHGTNVISCWGSDATVAKLSLTKGLSCSLPYNLTWDDDPQRVAAVLGRAERAGDARIGNAFWEQRQLQGIALTTTYLWSPRGTNMVQLTIQRTETP